MVASSGVLWCMGPTLFTCVVDGPDSTLLTYVVDRPRLYLPIVVGYGYWSREH